MQYGLGVGVGYCFGYMLADTFPYGAYRVEVPANRTTHFSLVSTPMTTKTTHPHSGRVDVPHSGEERLGADQQPKERPSPGRRRCSPVLLCRVCRVLCPVRVSCASRLIAGGTGRRATVDGRERAQGR